MKLRDIEIERNEQGIFAHVHNWAFGNHKSLMIWSKVGAEADAYKDKSDEELQLIVFKALRAVEESRLRRKRSVND